MRVRVWNEVLRLMPFAQDDNEMKILATGLSGMVGSYLAEKLKGDIEFERSSYPERINIVNSQEIEKWVSTSNASFILHIAAKANVDECEKDKTEIKKLRNEEINEDNTINFNAINSDAWKGSLSAFAVNVVGTKNIAEAAAKNGKKLIYISTDYVFGGKTKEAYTEETKPDPVNYYGWTKYWAEQIAELTSPNTLIVRIALPYGSLFHKRPDIVKRFREQFEKKQEIVAVEDQLITPTFLIDIASTILFLIHKNAQGIYHVTGGTTLSPYDFALAIAETFDYDKHLVKKAQYYEYYKNRAPRPQFLTMSNKKIQTFGMKALTVPEALQSLHQST